MQQPEKEGEQRQAGKDSDPQITQAPSQIAKEWLPDKKGQHYPREKKRYLYQASKQKQVDSHGTK
jgi:hypothetical protein